MPDQSAQQVECWSAVHAVLHAAYHTLVELCGRPDLVGLSEDTIRAIGYATGCLSKARELVARDIENAVVEQKPTGSA
jgi:hypothetical protein